MARERTRRRDAARDEPVDERELSPPYLYAGVAGLVVFALYAITLAPTTAFWDTSEYIATADILGIPHPPGNPLFVVLAKAWTLLLEPFGLSVAVRVNLFSAFMSAGAHALWFLVVHHILRYFTEDRFFRLAGASAAVLVSATAFTVWSQSNVNEKVYTVSLLTIALLSWLAFRWQENLGKGKDDNLLILMMFILALSVGNHLMAFLAAPAIGLFILWVHPQALLNWRLYVAGGVAMVLGLSIHLFLPIRSGLGPVINEAAPTCPDIGSAVSAIVTYGKAGCVALSEALNREQYVKPPLWPRQADLGDQLLNYLQYFDWQWARTLDGENTLFPRIRLPFTILFAALGVWGAVEHAQKDRASFLYVGTLFATLSFALVYYLNFRYGYSFPEPQDRGLHEVRERDYFFIASFSVWGLWAGMGIASLWRSAADDFETTLAKASPVLGLALIPLALNWGWASRSDDYAARDWAYNLLMSVEPYSVLFTNGDNDTFPLWYLQEVEGIRRDVTVIVTSYLNTPWYTKQLKRLTTPCPEDVDPSDDWSVIQCQRPYTFENTGAAYVTDPSQAGDRIPIVVDEIQVPTESIIPLADEQIDEAAAGMARVEESVVVEIGEIDARVQGGRYLQPWERFGLTLMVNAIDDRPIYFASSGNAALSLGVEPYLVRQGLAFKLHDGPLSEEETDYVRLEDTTLTPVTGDWLDPDRTATLLDEVFVHRSGIPEEWEHWPDISTIGIPNYYSWAYLAMIQHALDVGDTEALDRYRAKAQAWAELGST